MPRSDFWIPIMLITSLIPPPQKIAFWISIEMKDTFCIKYFKTAHTIALTLIYAKCPINSFKMAGAMWGLNWFNLDLYWPIVCDELRHGFVEGPVLFGEVVLREAVEKVFQVQNVGIVVKIELQLPILLNYRKTLKNLECFIWPSPPKKIICRAISTKFSPNTLIERSLS